MTREEAIQEFQNVKDLIRQDGKDWFDERDLELIDMAIEALSVANLKEEFESADAVPQLKQTDTLIIADALRYLAKDTERHLVDRTRADALRQQFLKYGASMCKGGDDK